MEAKLLLFNAKKLLRGIGDYQKQPCYKNHLLGYHDNNDKEIVPLPKGGEGESWGGEWREG